MKPTKNLKQVSFILVFCLSLLALVYTPHAPNLSALAIPTSPEHSDNDPNLIPGTEAKIEWAFPDHRKTDLSLVYIHGLSATRQEISPVMETIARDLEANIYFARLTGHGYDPAHREGLKSVRAETWLQDATSALGMGVSLGHKTVVVGLSMGGLLATMLAAKFPEQVKGLVLLSPAFAPADPRASFLLFPGGEWLARRLLGDTHGFTPKNAEHEKYWSTRYDINAASQLLRLTLLMRPELLKQIRSPTLVVYTPNDRAVSVPAIKTKFAQIGSAEKQLMSLDHAQDHVIAGQIVSPETTSELTALIERFLRERK